MRSAVATTIIWAGALLFPLAAYVATLNGSRALDGLLITVPALVSLGLVVALLFRRPLVALALLLAGAVAMASPQRSWELSYVEVLVVDLALGYIIVTQPRRSALVATSLTLGIQLGLATVGTEAETFPRAVPWIVLAMVTTWTVGTMIRQQREHAEALQTQATAQAVTAERLRIARELHDVISHSIGSIAIQAGMGSRVIDTQPDEARNALAAIEATSREALAGLRRTLVALRRTEPEPAPGATLVDPMPGLADIERLTTVLEDADVHIHLHWSDQPRQPPADVDLAAYRILQEALANIARHSGATRCWIRVDFHPTELVIEVDDDGGGGRDGVGGGFGIVGMRERVELLGGTFGAGPRPEGGFRVTARLPLPAEAA